MTVQEDWVSKLIDRLPNSPAAEWMLLAESRLHLYGQPYIIGKRIAEVCALAGRAVKRQTDLAVFLPPADSIDVLAVAIHLYATRLAVVSESSAPGLWATPTLLQERKDVWVIGNVMRLRSIFLQRLTLDGQPISDKVSCGWRANRASQTLMASAGDAAAPGIRLFSIDALMQGLVSAAVEGNCAPFAVVVDTMGMSEGRELARQLARLRFVSDNAPIVLLGMLGDSVTVQEAKAAKLAVWILRAGDIARLDATGTERSSLLGPIALARPGGADLASARLAAGIRVDIVTLQSHPAQRLFTPLLQTTERFERIAADQPELVSCARGLVRAVLSLTVPWKVHANAIANSNRVGRFAAPSLDARLQLLRQGKPATGEIATALERVVQRAEEVFAVLKAPHCVTAKQIALLQAANDAQTNQSPLQIVCGNETTKRAVQTYLAENGIDTITGAGCVSVITRAQLRRAIAVGKTDAAELLLVDPPGFADGIYFSGMTSRVRMHVYAFESEAVKRQLRFIARNTQCTSVPYGDKHKWVSGTNGRFADTDIEDTAALWRIEHSTITEAGVWPGSLPQVEQFTFESHDWLQRALAQVAEEERNESHEPGAPTPALTGPRICIELNDSEQSIVLAPDAYVLLLDDNQQAEPGAICASDVRVGMKVLIPRRPSTGDILEWLLERIELTPQLEVARQFRRIWQDGMAQLAEETQGSGAAALAQLLDFDVGVTTAQTVVHWMKGMVVGPRELRSISALGQRTKRTELIQHCNVIHAGIIELRRFYVAVTSKASEYAHAGASLGPDEVIDHRLGLRRSDLHEFNRTGRVIKVQVLSAQE